MEILLYISVLLLAVKETLSCSCMLAHSQSVYCHSDFILVATVKDIRKIYDRNEKNELPQSNVEFIDSYDTRIPIDVHYRVRVHRTYKGNLNREYQRAPKKYIYTGGSGASCGVRLEKRKTYLLSGTIRNNQLWISLCGWNQEHKTISLQQRKFLKFKYKKSCDCQAVTCIGDFCFKSRQLFKRDMCEYRPNWSLKNDCYQRHGMCVRMDGVCQWKKNNQFKVCLKQNNEPYPWRKRKFHVPEISPEFETNNESNDVPGAPGYREP